MTPRCRNGYILVEAVVAMAVLSISLVTIHQAMRQALMTRAQTRDLTQARFLLEQKMGELSLEPMIQEGMQTGEFGPGFSRFQWESNIVKVDLPALVPPTLPASTAARRAGLPPPPPPPSLFVAKATVTVRWTSGEGTYEESLETLFGPERLVGKEQNSVAPPTH